MESLLVKIFATALTFSQVTVTPDNIRTEFDPIQDQHKVVSLLRAGCTHMRKAFDIEDINIDDLIATAMDDPEAVSAGVPQFRGLNLGDMHVAYKQFCKGETVEKSPVDITSVIEYYNQSLANLPDHTRLRGLRLPGTSALLDGRGRRFAEVFEHDQRRVWVKLADIPVHVQAAFLAAEDKRFYQHHGMDERALIRAFIGNLTQSGRPQGGSTITQQLVKNLLVGDELTYERKMREMILAARVEHLLSKQEILELYLNSVFLGRSAWGVEMAARAYFGKSVSEVTPAEGALLAGLTKGPNFFNPDRHPARVKDRYAYVLQRMVEDDALKADEMRRIVGQLPDLIPFERPRRDIGFHFTDHVAREARALAGIDGLTAKTYTVHSTINPEVQRAAESALQEGLARYEIGAGRVTNRPAELNLARAIERIEAGKGATADKPAWLQALTNARFPLYDVHWAHAVVVEISGGRVHVGLTDGRIAPLSGPRNAIRALKLHDAVYVRVTETQARPTKAKKGVKAAPGGTIARAELRVRPAVQGAVLVMENQTGRILAMVGGFSYPLSQLNRTTQAQRQPGSAIKPLTYLAALAKGLQPNTLVRDEPITLAPIGGVTARTRPEDWWSPRNYEGGAMGIITLRRALEQSRNLATANLLAGGIDVTPALSLDRICALALEAHIYRECVRYYPFVLGAQPARPIDLATFYAAVANEGVRPTPHAIDSIEYDGQVIYRHKGTESGRIGSADGVAFYQLKTMLQGVLARGTAARLAAMSPYVAGKTGTTDNENDAWFVGFSNEVTIAVWVGYDNADGRRRTLGGRATGGSVAVPIFEPVMHAVWAQVSPRTALRPPTPETRRQLVAVRGEGGGQVEYMRRDAQGRPIDTQHRLIAQADTADVVRRGPPERRHDDDGYPPGPSLFPPWGGFGGGWGGGGGGRFGGFGGGPPPPRGEKPLWGRGYD